MDWRDANTAYTVHSGHESNEKNILKYFNQRKMSSKYTAEHTIVIILVI